MRLVINDGAFFVTLEDGLTPLFRFEGMSHREDVPSEKDLERMLVCVGGYDGKTSILTDVYTKNMYIIPIYINNREYYDVFRDEDGDYNPVRFMTRVLGVFLQRLEEGANNPDFEHRKSLINILTFICGGVTEDHIQTLFAEVEKLFMTEQTLIEGIVGKWKEVFDLDRSYPYPWETIH